MPRPVFRNTEILRKLSICWSLKPVRRWPDYAAIGIGAVEITLFRHGVYNLNLPPFNQGLNAEFAWSTQAQAAIGPGFLAVTLYTQLVYRNVDVG
jgi:hypothetical protein